MWSTVISRQTAGLRYRTDVDILPGVALLLLSAECAGEPPHFWLLRAETPSLQSAMQICVISSGDLALAAEDNVEYYAEIQRCCTQQATSCRQTVRTQELPYLHLYLRFVGRVS